MYFLFLRLYISKKIYIKTVSMFNYLFLWIFFNKLPEAFLILILSTHPFKKEGKLILPGRH